MKTIAFGDLHGRDIWKFIINKELPGRVIVMGDYFDSYDISTQREIQNFKELIGYKKAHPKIEFIFLIGNHDMQYFPEMGYTGTKGYQFHACIPITVAVDENREHLQMAYQMEDENILFTHAGVSKTFLDNNKKYLNPEHPTCTGGFLNDLWKHKPNSFVFKRGGEKHGDDVFQSPVWIRPRSLEIDGTRDTIRQVVGHTAMDNVKVVDNWLYFIDTLGTSGEYLVIEDGEIRITKQ